MTGAEARARIRAESPLPIRHETVEADGDHTLYFGSSSCPSGLLPRIVYNDEWCQLLLVLVDRRDGTFRDSSFGWKALPEAFRLLEQFLRERGDGGDLAVARAAV